MEPSFWILAKPWLGGPSSDYVTELSTSGSWGTRHLPTGKYLPNVAGAPIASAGEAAGAVSTSGLTALSAAVPAIGLGVGVLALGVGIWTAFKVHKVDKKVDALKADVQQVGQRLDALSGFLANSLGTLDALVRRNGVVLERMVENQATLAEGLALIHRDLVQGFDRVHEAIQSTAALAEAMDLEHRMRTLLRYYDICTQALQASREPPAEDLRRVIDSAVDLVAWLDTRLNALPVGTAQRLPLFVARAFAWRLESEAREQRGDGLGALAIDRARFLDAVRHEVLAIVSKVPPLQLLEWRPIVAEYVYLSRALQDSVTMVEFDDGQVMAMVSQAVVGWDDGLDDLVEQMTKGAPVMLGDTEVGPPVAQSVDLDTIDSILEWGALTGAPVDAIPRSVTRAEVGSALGLPAERVPGTVDAIRGLVKSGGVARDQVKQRLVKELIR